MRACFRGVLLGSCVLTVSASASAPPGRYVIDTRATATLRDDTVTDTKTGLTWQREVPSSIPDWCSGSGGACSHVQATNQCANLSLGGMSGFRLPSVSELLTLVDPTVSQPAVDGAAFPSTPALAHWTSSAAPSSPSNAWSVDFAKGSSAQTPRTQALRVRCVRKTG